MVKNSKTVPGTSLLKIGAQTISVELADTEEKITRGLSYRDKLAENAGMYFVLDSKKHKSFWMKEMRFPIDIIWINSGRVVGIEKNAPIPDSSDIPTFNSPTEVTNVLEVNSGYSDKYHIKVDDKVEMIK